MSRALSVDLRVRVLSAVSAGATHRDAGERFGVSAASVSRWRKRQLGSPQPKPLGGDRRSQGMEAHGAAILALVADRRDMTLAEIKIKAGLAEKCLRASIGGLWRFFDRHKITLKKSRRMPASRTVPTS